MGITLGAVSFQAFWIPQLAERLGIGNELSMKARVAKCALIRLHRPVVNVRLPAQRSAISVCIIENCGYAMAAFCDPFDEGATRILFLDNGLRGNTVQPKAACFRNKSADFRCTFVPF
jgi:hypothetical protein